MSTHAPSAAIDEREAVERFQCFGGSCGAWVQGLGPSGSAAQAARQARQRLESWHSQFSRFDPASELSRLNADRRSNVPVTPAMLRFVDAALAAATITGGLVDPTLVSELEHAGYQTHLEPRPLPLPEALRFASPRRPGAPRRDSRWQQVRLDRRTATVTRPPGIRLDSGGIAKGLFGDFLAEELVDYASFAIDAAGDVRLGGTQGLKRQVQVASPFEDSVLHVFELARGAAATSGIGRRSWIGEDGRPAHHLLDPSTGKPAFTGLIQVTALAPSGIEAEALSKAALLSGPERAADWLPHGGVIVFEDVGHHVIEPAEGLA
ncbi:MAG: FAD:protein FMN transferase [Solirubrobacterales bacterium]|nr:FAD:protein FMN transferase [Solirubrobacterales bacterium]